MRRTIPPITRALIIVNVLLFAGEFRPR